MWGEQWWNLWSQSSWGKSPKETSSLTHFEKHETVMKTKPEMSGYPHQFVTKKIIIVHALNKADQGLAAENITNTTDFSISSAYTFWQKIEAEQTFCLTDAETVVPRTAADKSRAFSGNFTPVDQGPKAFLPGIFKQMTTWL